MVPLWKWEGEERERKQKKKFKTIKRGKGVEKSYSEERWVVVILKGR